MGKLVQTMGKNYEIIDSYHSQKAKFEILQINQSENFHSSSDSQLKQVRVKLNNGTIVTKTGALQVIQGRIRMKDYGILQKIMKRELKPTYQGYGEIYLEPSSWHYMLHKLDHEEILIDEEMFFCCESTIEVSTAKIPASSAQLIKLKGTGICVLQSPVPENQIIKFELFDEQLKIDHNCVILRSSSLQSSQNPSFKTFLQSFAFFHEHKCLQTFYGTGKIWIAPIRLLN